MLLPTPLRTVTVDNYKVELVEVTTEIGELGSRFFGAAKDLKDRIKGAESRISQTSATPGKASGAKIAGLIEEREELKAELDELARQYKADATRLEGRQKKLASMVRSGVEYASIPCIILKDYLSKQLTITRNDTKDVVEQRALTGDELQMALPEGD